MSQPATLTVKAARADRPVPKLGRREVRRDKRTGRDMSCIHADEVVEVPNHPYYRRRLRKGDLLIAEAAPARPAKAAKRGDR